MGPALSPAAASCSGSCQEMTSACASASPPLCPVPLIQCVQREEGAPPGSGPGLGMDEALGREGVGGGCGAFRQSGLLVSFPEVAGQALGSWGGPSWTVLGAEAC